jgi:hypothetical protein
MSNWKFTDATNTVVFRENESCLVSAIADWIAEGNTPEPADVPPFGPIRTAYLDTVRLTREDILNRISGIGFAAMVAGDTVTVNGVIAARKALLDITKDAGVLAATDADGLKNAVIAAYRAMVIAAPPAVRSAFNAASA